MRDVLAGRGPGLKACLIGVLILVMVVAMMFVRGLVGERWQRAEAAKAEVGYAWGGETQTLVGPFLVVPYRIEREVATRAGSTLLSEERFAVFLPEALDVVADLGSETRYRGIYEVTAYTADVVMSGVFLPPDMEALTRQPDLVAWDDAFVAFGITDNRGIKNAIDLQWGDGTAKRFLPGAGLFLYGESGIHADLEARDLAGERAFRIVLKLNGSQTLGVVPVGRDTTVAMTSNWPHPSFQGGFLPTTRQVTKDGFSARWEIPQLARSFPQSWSQARKIESETDSYELRTRPVNPHAADLVQARFAVDLRLGSDIYQQIDRATKYAILFFGFTFLAFFLYEILLGQRVHALQYLMVGASQCIFYLLLLSMSEHIGFLWAYVIAAAANIGLIAAYVRTVLRSPAFAVVIFAVLGVIYGLLFSLLQVEDFALLFGSIAAFVALALTMFLTRNVDWYGERARQASA